MPVEGAGHTAYQRRQDEIARQQASGWQTAQVNPAQVNVGSLDANGQWQREWGNTPQVDQAHTLAGEAAAQYRSDLPNLKRQMAERLAQNTNRQLSQGLKKTTTNMASRGLGYGGLQQSAQADLQSRAAASLSGSISGINTMLDDKADIMESSLIDQGLSNQKYLQALQDMQFEQAMAKYQADSQVFGSGLGLLTTVATGAAL